MRGFFKAPQFLNGASREEKDESDSRQAAPGFYASQMQCGILPVLETTVAIESGAAKMENLPIILQKPDVPPEKQMLALRAEAHLIERPPLL